MQNLCNPVHFNADLISFETRSELADIAEAIDEDVQLFAHVRQFDAAFAASRTARTKFGTTPMRGADKGDRYECSFTLYISDRLCPKFASIDEAMTYLRQYAADVMNPETGEA